MYLAVPMTLYAVERLTRAIRSTIKSVKVLEVTRELIVTPEKIAGIIYFMVTD